MHKIDKAAILDINPIVKRTGANNSIAVAAKAVNSYGKRGTLYSYLKRYRVDSQEDIFVSPE
jgi:hypothetical protein